jgi:hypothetical protein
MSDEEFNRIMPQEFWREVVDRVAQEVPGTLLLAEAFWLMEGYFVRTLGMHRVYNSAFMVMTRDEDNAKYRSVIKNTLEFDPDIMKRYVNFMSNPDERTAIDQYGKGDKAFGVTVMMATLPGLPMFGHGQIEGFTEKYGMEYQRPRYDETPDQWMVERHEREIGPLLKRRWLFAESYNFLLYDFFCDSGSVDENVFAYSNRVSDQPALVVYNNVYGSTSGTIRMSAAYADKGAGGLRQRSLWEGLGLQDGQAIVSFRDLLTGLEYLRRAGEIGERGLRVNLHAYQSYVFLDWRELHSTIEKPWARLCDSLGGRGVPSLEDALINLELRPAHDALRKVLDPAIVHMMVEVAEVPQSPGANVQKKPAPRAQNAFLERAWSAFAELLMTALPAYAKFTGTRAGVYATQPEAMAPALRKLLRGATRLPALEELFPAKWDAAARRVIPNDHPRVPSTALWGPVLAWCVLQALAEAIDSKNRDEVALDLFDRLRLREPLAQAFHALGLDGEDGWSGAALVKALLLVQSGAGTKTSADAEKEQAEASTAAQGAQAAADALIVPPGLWEDPDICWLSGAHVAGDHTYLVREQFEELLWWLALPKLLILAESPAPRRADAAIILDEIHKALVTLEDAGYRLDELLEPEDAAMAEATDSDEPEEDAAESAPKASAEPDAEASDPQESVSATPVGPKGPDGPPEEN